MLKKILLSLIALVALVGCASTSSILNINPGIALPARHNGIANVTLSITGADKRADPALAKVGRGNQLVSLMASRDLRFLLQEALEKQMTARGYTIAANSGMEMQVVIDQLYADVLQGDVRYKINTHARVSIIVNARNGNKFTQNYQARYSVDGAFQATNSNIAKTINIALTNIMTDMANDNRINDFIRDNSLTS